ncbi:MAG: helix-turn-helix domain-containing protein [Pirellulales bacterium]
MVQAGTFRQDLYYRLNGFSITLPPLRDRLSDVRPLADYFLKTLSREFHKKTSGFTPEVYELLEAYNWPGNVRELHSAIRYALVNSTTELVTPDCLPAVCRSGNKTAGVTGPESPEVDSQSMSDVIALAERLLAEGSNDIYRSVVHAVEGALFETVLKATKGNQQSAAERLGISRMTLRAKLKARNGEDKSEESL